MYLNPETAAAVVAMLCDFHVRDGMLTAACGCQWPEDHLCRTAKPELPVLADALEKAGDLGAFDEAFAGWKISNGMIFTPTGYCYPPGDIYAIPIRIQQIAEYERQLRTPTQLLL